MLVINKAVIDLSYFYLLFESATQKICTRKIFSSATDGGTASNSTFFSHGIGNTVFSSYSRDICNTKKRVYRSMHLVIVIFGHSSHCNCLFICRQDAFW